MFTIAFDGSFPHNKVIKANNKPYQADSTGKNKSQTKIKIKNKILGSLNN